MKKIINFFHEVKKEAKIVHWPKGKQLVNYSVTTLSMIVFFGLFFFGLDALFAFLKDVIK